MSEPKISEAAQKFSRVCFIGASPEGYARAAQGLIDEALRRVFSAIQIRPVAPGPLSSSVPEVPPSTVFRGVKVETYDNSPPPTDAEVDAMFPAPSSGRVKHPSPLSDPFPIVTALEKELEETPRPEPEPAPESSPDDGRRLTMDAYLKALNERDDARKEVVRLKARNAGLGDAVQHAVAKADRLAAELEQAKQRPSMGPIPDEVCDKAVMVYEQGDEGSMRSDMRAALEAVRPDLCRYEVVKTRHPLWVDKDGDVWTSELLADAEAMEFWLKLYGPLNPVICVRDPARKEVK